FNDRAAAVKRSETATNRIVKEKQAPPLLPAPLPVSFIKEYGGRTAHVERIHAARHRDGHGFITCGECLGRNSAALAAEHQAAVRGKIGLGQRAFIGAGMSGDAA